MGFNTIAKGALAHSADVNQYEKVWTAQRDAGALSFLGQISTPATAPTVTLASGSISGTAYQWGFYWITGIEDGTGSYNITGRTTPSPYSAAQALSSQEAQISISGISIPTGVIGWGVVRNHSGGATWYEVPGSEQFMSSSGSMPTMYIDNTIDANLVTAAPSSNTTGTYLENYLRTDSGAPNPQTVANSVTFVSGLDMDSDSHMNNSGGANAWSHALFFRANDVSSNNIGFIIQAEGPSGQMHVATLGGAGMYDVDQSGNITAAGSITSSSGQLGSASGTWTPASGSLNVAVGTVINVAAVPTGAKSLTVQSTSGYSPNFTWVGSMTTSGFFGMNLDAAQSYGRTFWTDAISSTTLYGAAVTMGVADGSYVTAGYFQISGGYLQFVTTGAPAANTTSAEVVRWAVN